MDTLISGLVLSFITGLTIFAINHRDAFDKIFWWIYGIAFFIYSILITWSIGIGISISRLERYINKEMFIEAKNSLPTLPFDLMTLNVIFFSFMIYLYFISYISKIINDSKKNKPKN